MQMPEISVLVCTYEPNKAFLIRQIESISFEVSTYPAKIIISDDTTVGVNDLNDAILKLGGDLRYEIIPGPKVGSSSHNFLSSIISISNSISYDSWLFLSDQDDVWIEGKVSEYLKVIKTIDNNVPQLIFSDAEVINSEEVILSRSFHELQGISDSVLLGDDILFENCVQGATICINGAMILLVSNLLKNEDLSKIAMHDWWLAIVARYYGKWTYVNKPLIKYRQHGGNIVGVKSKRGLLAIGTTTPLVAMRKLYKIYKQYTLFVDIISKEKSNDEIIHRKLNLNFNSKVKYFFVIIISKFCKAFSFLKI